LKMPTIYLSKELYDELIKRGKNVTEFIDKAVTEALKKEQKEEKRR